MFVVVKIHHHLHFTTSITLLDVELHVVNHALSITLRVSCGLPKPSSNFSISRRVPRDCGTVVGTTAWIFRLRMAHASSSVATWVVRSCSPTTSMLPLRVSCLPVLSCRPAGGHRAVRWIMRPPRPSAREQGKCTGEALAPLATRGTNFKRITRLPLRADGHATS